MGKTHRMSAPQDFTFKSNVIGRPVHYRVASERLQRVDSDHRILEDLDLAEVQGVRWVDIRQGGFSDRRLDLKTPQKTLSIRQTISARKTLDNAHVASFFAVTRAVIRAVAALQPNAEFTTGPSPGDRLLGFLVPAFYTALMSAVFVWALEERLTSPSWMPFAAAGLLILGLAAMWESRLWRSPPSRRISEVASELNRALQHGEAPILSR